MVHAMDIEKQKLHDQTILLMSQSNQWVNKDNGFFYG